MPSVRHPHTAPASVRTPSSALSLPA